MPETRACIESELLLCDERACWMPIFYESKKVRQRGSEGFTDKEKIADVGLVDLIWNVYKRGAMECLFSHSPPEERADKAVDLLAGDSKPRHRPFSRQVAVDLY